MDPKLKVREPGIWFIMLLVQIPQLAGINVEGSSFDTLIFPVNSFISQYFMYL